MHPGADDGIGDSSSIRHRVYRPTEIKQAPADQHTAKTSTRKDSHQICAEFIGFDPADPDQSGRVKCSRNGLLDVDAMRSYKWSYGVDPTAKNMAIATTPRYITDRAHRGVANQIWGTTKLLDTREVHDQRQARQGREMVNESFMEERENARRSPLRQTMVFVRRRLAHSTIPHEINDACSG